MISIEISRKIIHLFSSLIPLGYLWYVQDKFLMVVIIGLLSLFSVILELLRKKNNFIKYLFNNYFNFMLRNSEIKGNMTGATWLLFGSLITIFLYPIYIAVAALLFLSIGDSFAAIVGKKIPRIKIGEKSLIGSIAGILSSIFVVNLVNNVLPINIIVLGAIIAMLVEILPIPINDNLSIPVISGFFMVITI